MERKEDHQEEVKNLLSKLQGSPIMEDWYYLRMINLCGAIKTIADSISGDVQTVGGNSKEDQKTGLERIDNKVYQIYYIADALSDYTHSDNWNHLLNLADTMIKLNKA